MENEGLIHVSLTKSELELLLSDLAVAVNNYYLNSDDNWDYNKRGILIDKLNKIIKGE